MTLLKSALAVAAIIALSSARDFIYTPKDCPADWTPNIIGNDDTSFCCYGSTTINGDEGYCCVQDNNAGFTSSGGDDGGDDDGDLNDDCFPFCDAAVTDNEKRAQPSSPCAAKVPISASDYSERVSAASKSLAAEASKTTSDSSRPQTNTASTTTESSSTAEATHSSSTAEATHSSSKSADSAETSATDDDSNAAGSMPTGGLMYVGGAVAAVALLI